MPAPQPLYDLVLLLDGAADEQRRGEILESVQAAVKKGGEVVNEQDWGARALAYEIDHRKDAEYHLLQFHGTAELLAQLDRTLRITDEVVRFRIIKLAPGTPPPPEHRVEARPSAGAADGGPAPAASELPESSPAEPEETRPAEADAQAAVLEGAAEPVAVAAGEPADAEPEADAAPGDDA